MAEGEVGAHDYPDSETGRGVRMQCLRMVYVVLRGVGCLLEHLVRRMNNVPIREARCRMLRLRPPTKALRPENRPGIRRVTCWRGPESRERVKPPFRCLRDYLATFTITLTGSLIGLILSRTCFAYVDSFLSPGSRSSSLAHHTTHPHRHHRTTSVTRRYSHRPNGFCALGFFSVPVLSPPCEVAPLTVSPAPLVVSLTVLVKPVVVSPTVLPMPPTTGNVSGLVPAFFRKASLRAYQPLRRYQ